MAATFRPRPWRLSALAAPASATPLLLNTPPPPPVLLARTQQMIRHAASKSTARMSPVLRMMYKHSRLKLNDQRASVSLQEKAMKDDRATVPDDEYAFLSPFTVVPLPWHKTKHAPWRERLAYYKAVLLRRVTDRLAIAQQEWRLKTRFFMRAPFRASRDGVVEAALRLHTDMSRCLAAGGAADKARLAQICVPKLYRSLAAAIDARPRGRSYRWERVELLRDARLGLWGWPRLLDHKWGEVDLGATRQSYRQAVVGIRSKQRLTEVNAGETGETPPAVRAMTLLEYVVLWKPMDVANRTQGEWKIYGTLKETPLGAIAKENEEMQMLQKLDAEKNIAEKQAKVAK